MASLPPRVKTASDVAGSGRPPKPSSHAASSSKIFKANADKFYGGSGKMSATQSSQGSFFQRNAAAFCGEQAPNAGERPFKVDKESEEVVPKSVLHDRRVREEVSKFGGFVDLFLLGKR